MFRPKAVLGVALGVYVWSSAASCTGLHTPKVYLHAPAQLQCGHLKPSQGNARFCWTLLVESPCCLVEYLHMHSPFPLILMVLCGRAGVYMTCTACNVMWWLRGSLLDVRQMV